MIKTSEGSRGSKKETLNDLSREVDTLGGIMTKKTNPGARWEIRADGTPRTYRDDHAIAIDSARYLKFKNPMVEVTLRDLETGETTVIKVPPGYVP
jgi:hypothetical protein